MAEENHAGNLANMVTNALFKFADEDNDEELNSEEI